MVLRLVQYLAIALVSAFFANIVVDKTGEKIKGQFEVILFTLSLCDHCAVFETDIMQEYKQHELAKSARLVRVNIDDEGTGAYHLGKPISHAPTFVIMKNGKEVARLSGLVDKVQFYVFVRDHVFPPMELAFNKVSP